MDEEASISRSTWCEDCGMRCTGLHMYAYLDEDLIENELKDPILLQPLIDPVDLPCSHTFSRFSITASLHQNGQCPLCRKPASSGDIRSSSYSLNSLVNRLKVKCPNSCEEARNGITREKLKGHLAKCPMAIVACKNQGCGIELARCAMQSHESAECEYRKVLCDGCGLCFPSAEQKGHNCLKALRAEVDTLRKEQGEMRSLLVAMQLEHQSFRAALERRPSPIGAMNDTFEVCTDATDVPVNRQVHFDPWRFAVVDGGVVFWLPSRSCFLELCAMSNGWFRTRTPRGDRVWWSSGGSDSQAVQNVPEAQTAPFEGDRITTEAQHVVGKWHLHFRPGVCIEARNESDNGVLTIYCQAPYNIIFGARNENNINVFDY